MKKTTLLFVAILFMQLATQTTFSQTEYQLDSIQRFDWNTNTAAFKMNSRQYYTYDNGGTKETYSITDMLTGTVWDPSLRYNKIYNEDNNVIEKVIEVYDSGLDIWNASTKEVYTYDASQNLVLFEDFTSSDGGITWDIPRTQIDYSYNLDNLETQRLRAFYNASLMDFVDLDRTITSYNGLNIVEEVSSQWLSSSSTWLNTIKIEPTYDGNLPMQNDFFSWQGSSWDSQPYLQQILTYDNDLLTEKVNQAWNSAGSFWQNSFRTTQAFDAIGNKIQNNTFDWDDNTASWLNLKQELWYWSEASELLDLEEELIDYGNVRIVPNPASNFFTIQGLNLSDFTNNGVSVNIHALNGGTVMNTRITSSAIPLVDTNSLPSGVYILSVNTANFNITRKLIINN